MFDFPTPPPAEYSELEQATSHARLVRAIPGARNRTRALIAMALVDDNSLFRTQGEQASRLQKARILPPGDWDSIRDTYHVLADAFDSKRAYWRDQVGLGKER